jgi:hypothetical protein
VYLAFNASPAIWNTWVKIAGRQKASDEPLANCLLYRLANGIGDPNALSTPEAREDASNRLRVLGNMTRFAATLDAYLRLDFEWFEIDLLNPNGRIWLDARTEIP